MPTLSSVKRTLKKHFIPHKGNNYKPHLLRERGALILASLVAVLFITSLLPRLATTRFPLFGTIFSTVLIDLANEDRAIAHAAPLKSSPILEAAARMKAEDMAKGAYFAHTSPAGVTPWQWFQRAGYRYTYAGENLALNFADSADVERAWMNSPGHRANILNTNFTEIGIAVATGTYEGRDATFVVQLFGRPDLRASPRRRQTPPSASAGQKTPPPAVASRPLSAGEPDIETLIENDLFVAVKIAGEEAPTPIPMPTPPTAGEASRLWRFFASPREAVSWAYFALAILVGAALSFLLTIEVKRQEPRHALYAVLLLVLIAGALWLSQAPGGGTVVI